MFRFQSAANCRAAFFHVFDGVELLDVRDDGFNRLRVITKATQAFGHGAIDDLQHAAACEQFVFHERDVRFNTGGIAVHEERDRAGRREHGDLGITIADLFATSQSTIPTFAGFGLEIIKLRTRLNRFHSIAMQLDDLEHGFDVVLLGSLDDTRATCVAIACERLHRTGEFGGLLVRMTGHDRGDRTGEGAAFIAVIRQTVTHAERTEIREAETERAIDVRVLRDFFRGIARVVHEDFLRGDIDANSSFEAFNVELAVLALELHQVQGSKIARGVVEENVFAARIGGVDRLGASTGVPLLDRTVILHSGVAANPSAFGNLGEKLGRVFLFERFAGGRGLRPPFLARERGFHELIASAYGKVFVLIHDAAISFAIV